MRLARRLARLCFHTHGQRAGDARGNEHHKKRCLLYTSTAGPSINTQITVVSLVSSLAAVLFLTYSIF